MVNINSTIFWDIMRCSAVQAYSRFGETHCVYIQGRIIPSKRKLIYNEVEEFTSQDIVHFVIIPLFTKTIEQVM
jgi:hypothetical protein